MLLEEADLFPGHYVIEVSSPGIRRPLRTPEHFAAAVGRRIELKVADRGRVRGVLREATPAVLRLEEIRSGTGSDAAPDAVLVEIAAADVREANLDADFDAQALINADRKQRKAAKRDRRQQRRQSHRGRRRPGKTSAPDEDEADGST
jgi:ribosome maturation factor RimP